VNEQKKVAAAGGSGVATCLSYGAPGFGGSAARKGQSRHGAFRASASAPVAVIPEADNLSDTTEVEAYNSSGNKRPVVLSQRAQEIANEILEKNGQGQLSRDEMTQIAEMLFNAARTPIPQKKATPKKQTHKSGHGFSKDDIEVQLHNHLNESCRIIPPAASVHLHDLTASHMGHSTTPNHMHPKNSPSNAPSRGYCPTVHRDFSPGHEAGVPEAPLLANKTAKVPKLNFPERIHSFPDSLGSPRSDISVGSSNSAFTESSRRSGILNWCSNVVTSS
jgi:hypothetical protein